MVSPDHGRIGKVKEARLGNRLFAAALRQAYFQLWEAKMGRSILLWLLGVPIPIIILLAIFWH